MTNKRPWDDPEDGNDEAILEAFFEHFPHLQDNMRFYASVMERGAAFSVAIVTVLHQLCLGFIQLHIRTPRWVWRVTFVSLCFLGGFAATATVSWLLAALFVQ